MPEGDTIYRAARALERALAGRTVTRFTSVYPHLNRVDHDAPLAGRVVESVASAGKHLLMTFSGGLVLRTHMRMNGSWHIYRPGERWQRPGHEMRIVVETPDFHAIAFNVPVAEFIAASKLAHAGSLQRLGPDLLADDFDPADAVARLSRLSETSIADALLDQTAIAGIGNIYKSEALFAARIDPFTPVDSLPPERIERAVTMATKLMKAAALNSRTPKWVYDRAGQPCRRCGSPVLVQRQGPHARRTYWCGRCQQ